MVVVSVPFGDDTGETGLRSDTTGSVGRVAGLIHLVQTQTGGEPVLREF